MKKLFLLFSLAAVSITATAQSSVDVGTSQMSEDRWSDALPYNKNLRLFLGAGLGYTDHSDEYATEGYPKHIKLIGSYYAENIPWIFDLGFGFNNQNFTTSGKNNASGFMFELAGRAQFVGDYQMGPVLNTYLNQGANYGSGDNNVMFFGVQAFKEFQAFQDRYTVRIGGKLMTDLNINGEFINVAMLEAAIGLPVFRETTVTENIQSSPAADRAITSIKADIEPEELFPKASVVNFQLNSANINNKDQNYIQRVARTLENNSQLFERVEVVGHADITGPASLNQELSRERAVNVARILTGTDLKGKVELAWKGAQEPLALGMSDDSLRQNRRVELKFHGVTNEKALLALLRSIQ